ncbi:probable inactive leucine-rich repeat receptor-like protein kinase At3g03770 isoform X1 [Ziziphus jujuba]|uniref:Probable inactive leucine-rich repeat receptor-like protein kinase At3g03770 isoform X1 n=1 Tax=Ziziphus jujuba TaxID=326968 RepID=A0A6P6GHQ4_ZIZJJ|nr:probable inactive leucine-rich repeat receptor-like protein kinase At3g03770 isoform X1 [Ziziphus jujuba]
MGHFECFILLVVCEILFLPYTQELQTSQSQVLAQLRKHLEYPPALQIWENYNGDFCNLSSEHMSISCQENSVTELKIMGDKNLKVRDFNGFAAPNQSLSEKFSVDSFVTTLSRLPNLRVLSLVSLGIWGPLPDKIHRLSELELLDLSSNFFFGSIPAKISTMVKLHTLILDGNYFNDTVPDWLDSLSNLTIVSLKSNRLKGQFPNSICRIKTLTDIAISHNELSGKLPGLSNLTSLHVLDLRENHFDSELPEMPKGLVTVLLSKNSFSGKIPEQFGDLGQLQHLDLSFNNLTGIPLPDLFSLANISYLTLASNNLSGSIPEQLNCGEKLGFVDISSNKLIGGLPSCLYSSDNRVIKYDWNCLSIDSQHQHHGSYCKEAFIRGKQSKNTEIMIVAAAIIGLILVIVLLALGILLLRKKKGARRTYKQHILPKIVQANSPSGVCSELITNARFISQAVKVGTQGAPVCRLFSFEELREATNNFDVSMFMGEASVGQLYKGKLENGAYVAIRSLALTKKYSVQNLKVKLDWLSKLHHQHLVCFLGYCIMSGEQDDSSANKVLLVFEYVPNGDYRTYLSENCPEKVLKWSDRLTILIGVAKAVHFLHTGVIPGSFNNRLKTNNILLDEHRIAKLSDYGISVITEEIEKFEAKGEGSKSRRANIVTYPCRSHKQNLGDDVYNFGFILLESLVGPVVSGKGETFLLNEMASFGSQDGRRRIVDPVVLTTCSQESLSIVVSITKKCISSELSSRPSFEDVLWNLQYAAQVQATADADQKSDSIS